MASEASPSAPPPDAPVIKNKGLHPSTSEGASASSSASSSSASPSSNSVEKGPVTARRQRHRHQKPHSHHHHHHNHHHRRHVQRGNRRSRSRSPTPNGSDNSDFEQEEIPRSVFELTQSNEDKKSIQTIRDGAIRTKIVAKSLVTFKWTEPPSTVLLVKKLNDEPCTELLKLMARAFNQQNLNVIIEESVAKEEDLEGIDFEIETPSLLESVDFCVTLGGDGTLLWASHKFPEACPPMISVAMGSLGFLTTFPDKEPLPLIQKLIDQEMKMTLRSRIEGAIYDAEGKFQTAHTVLNEVVLRGVKGSMIGVEIYLEEGHGAADPITIATGDGIIVSTTNGSTAYSLSAGGSVVHPSISCILITPVCPHSLSFRPLIVSDAVTIRLRIPDDARNEGVAVFDGKYPFDMKKGSELICTMSPFPVPCVSSAEGETRDWFNALRQSFGWNDRVSQKPQ